MYFAKISLISQQMVIYPVVGGVQSQEVWSLHAVLDHSSVGLRDSKTEDDCDSVPMIRVLGPWDRVGLSSLHTVHSSVGLRDRR